MRRQTTLHRKSAASSADVARQFLTDKRLTWRISEVLEVTGLGHTTVKELIADGTLRSTKVRGVRLIHDDSLRQLLNISP